MRTFDTPEPITVELDLGAANVDIRASERTDTVVNVEPTNAGSRSDITAAQQTRSTNRAGRLSITAPKSWRQWLPFGGRESVDVHVELPIGSRVLGAAGVVALKMQRPHGRVQIQDGSRKPARRGGGRGAAHCRRGQYRRRSRERLRRAQDVVGVGTHRQR